MEFLRPTYFIFYTRWIQDIFLLGHRPASLLSDTTANYNIEGNTYVNGFYLRPVSLADMLAAPFTYNIVALVKDK